ncbi:hypothetical protein [Mesorhizobium sp. CN2-181]
MDILTMRPVETIGFFVARDFFDADFIPAAASARNLRLSQKQEWR